MLCFCLIIIVVIVYVLLFDCVWLCMCVFVGSDGCLVFLCLVDVCDCLVVDQTSRSVYLCISVFGFALYSICVCVVCSCIFVCVVCACVVLCVCVQCCGCV